MSATPVGAHRAAVLLRSLLNQDGRAISVRLAIDLMDGAVLPIGGRSDERAVRRAVEALRSWGNRVEWATSDLGGPTVRLIPPAQSNVEQRLALSRDEDHLRRAARVALQLMDPEQDVEPHVLLKAHVPRDRISFRYGRDSAEYEGVPYWIEPTGRPFVLVATAMGDFGFHADAIRSLRVIGSGDDIEGHDQSPEFIDAGPVPRSWWVRGRGRPTDLVKLREAQILVAAIHSSVATNGSRTASGSAVGLERLSEMTSVGVEQIQALGPVIEQLDDTIRIGDDGVEVVARDIGPEALLDGSQALITRLDLMALISLGGAATIVEPRLTISAMSNLAARLDGFLDRIRLPRIQEPLPCAVEIVDAALANADGHPIPLPVLLRGGETSTAHTLRVENLVWRSERWWITGSIDDEPISGGRISLASVVEVDPET